MTSTVERPAPRAGGPAIPGPAARWIGDHVVAVTAIAVVALRLPYVDAAPGADEAGYLMVARQWHAGGSLYGDYWVDRPPLLVSIFRVADQLGGLVPLRLVGAAAAALVVVGAARVARQVVGLRGDGPGRSRGTAARAGGVAALVAAGLCISPLVGALEVDGELLAAPFVVWGMSAFLAAVDPSRDDGGRLRAAVAAGAAGAAAALVKQNFVDVGVLAAVVVALGVLRRQLSGARAAGLSAGFVGGAVSATGLVAGWTTLHGTSLRAAYDAMYPFRVTAARAMAASGNGAPVTRLTHLLAELALSGVPVLLVVAATALTTHRVRDTAMSALAAVIAFDVLSILAGGNFWSHYLVQLVVPVAVVSGVVVASLPSRTTMQRGARAGVAMVLLSGVAAWTVAAPAGTSPGSSLGRAVGAASRSGDTIVTLYGHPDVTESSGLASPYPYLWSLPLKVRDPHEHLLAQTLAGTEAPTWLVAWSGIRSIGVDATGAERVVAERYHRVAVLRGHTVYLRDGVERPRPAPGRTDHRQR